MNAPPLSGAYRRHQSPTHSIGGPENIGQRYRAPSAHLSYRSWAGEVCSEKCGPGMMAFWRKIDGEPEVLPPEF